MIPLRACHSPHRPSSCLLDNLISLRSRGSNTLSALLHPKTFTPTTVIWINWRDLSLSFPARCLTNSRYLHSRSYSQVFTKPPIIQSCLVQTPIMSPTKHCALQYCSFPYPNKHVHGPDNRLFLRIIHGTHHTLRLPVPQRQCHQWTILHFPISNDAKSLILRSSEISFTPEVIQHGQPFLD